MPEDKPEPDAFGWIRVTDKDTGHQSSIRESQFAHGNYQAIKEDASEPNTGQPLPPKFNAVKATSGQKAVEREQSNG